MFVPEQVAVYFDGHAQTWDEIAPGRGRIDCILDNIFLNAFLQKRYSPAGCSVLDVGCGTGVLFPYLKERGVTEITGIDLSGKMIEQAGKKAGSGVDLICADACSYNYGKTFDLIIVFNSLPHFQSDELLFSHLVRFLGKNGVISVAHSMGRDELNRLHGTVATDISRVLPSADELAVVMSQYCKICCCVSNDEIFQIAGRTLNSED